MKVRILFSLLALFIASCSVFQSSEQQLQQERENIVQASSDIFNKLILKGQAVQVYQEASEDFQNTVLPKQFEHKLSMLLRAYPQSDVELMGYEPVDQDGVAAVYAKSVSQVKPLYFRLALVDNNGFKLTKFSVNEMSISPSESYAEFNPVIPVSKHQTVK